MDLSDLLDDELHLSHEALEQEQALIKKKDIKNAYSVERNYVNSKLFRDQFELLPVNHHVSQMLYKKAGELLDLMDGTDKEGMIAVNARTGTFIVDNLNRQPQALKTGFTTEEYNELLKCPDFVVLIHNHPDSSYPSGKDLITYQKEEKVKLSVIVGHDGTLYAIYAVSEKVEEIYNESVRKYMSDGLNEDSAKTLATRYLYLMNEQNNSKLFDVRRCRYE